MVDIHPQLCYAVASRQGVEALCERLKDVESVDIIENVIKAIQKISEEVPHAVVSCNCLEYLANVFEFLDLILQVFLLIITKNIEKDYYNVTIIDKKT